MSRMKSCTNYFFIVFKFVEEKIQMLALTINYNLINIESG